MANGPRIIFLPAEQILHNSFTLSSGLVYEVVEQGEAVFMPSAGTNSSRVAGVQVRLTLSVGEYWPMRQGLQAWSSGVVQASPCFESGSTSTFK